MVSCAKRFLLSISVYAVWLLMAILMPPILAVMLLLPRNLRYRNYFFFWWSSFFSKSVLSFLPQTITVKGVIPRHGDPLVIVANHTSLIDAFIIESIAGDERRIWMFKDVFHNIPIIGWLLGRIAIPVNRETVHKAANALIKVLHLAKEFNMHLILFPEGRRYNDGVVHRFKPGFARVAFRLKRSVLPIFLVGAGELFCYGLFNPLSRPIQIIIGDPLTPKTEETELDFMSRVQEWYTKVSIRQQQK